MSIKDLTECIAEGRENIEGRERVSLALERIQKSLEVISTPRRDDLAIALCWALEELEELKRKNRILRKKLEKQAVEPARKPKHDTKTKDLGFSDRTSDDSEDVRTRALKAARKKMAPKTDIFGRRVLD